VHGIAQQMHLETMIWLIDVLKDWGLRSLTYISKDGQASFSMLKLIASLLILW
jgi:hypothetical protein